MKALGLLQPITWDENAMQEVKRAFADAPMGQSESVYEAVNGCHLFSYQHSQQRALVALKCLRFEYGTRVEVVALAADKESAPLQLRQVFNAIENTAHQMGADEILYFTKHPAMAKAAGRFGAHITGAIVYKRIQRGH